MGQPTERLWSRNFLCIILINFLIFCTHFMALSTFPFYVESLGGSEALAGLAATLFSLVAVLLRPVIGWLLDNGKRRLILLIGIIGMGLMPVGYICVPVLAIAFVFRMVHGASLACSNTSTATIATDSVPHSRLAEGMGMFGMATALATSCAPALGLALMEKSFTALYLTAAGLCVVALGLFALLRLPKPVFEKKPLRLRELLDRDAMPASVITLVFMLSFGALENFLAKFASDNGLPSGGVFFAVMAVVLLLVRLTLGKVADQKGEAVFVYTCNASMFAALVLLSLVPNTVTFYLAAILAGYGFGGLEPALQSMAVHLAGPDRRGAANSTFLCAYDIGIGLGGGIAGSLITALGYGPMFSIIALSNVASLLLYVFWGRRQPSSFSYTLKQQKTEKI